MHQDGGAKAPPFFLCGRPCESRDLYAVFSRLMCGPAAAFHKLTPVAMGACACAQLRTRQARQFSCLAQCSSIDARCLARSTNFHASLTTIFRKGAHGKPPRDSIHLFLTMRFQGSRARPRRPTVE